MGRSRWVPPVPPGASWSPEVISLGPGAPLLGYCWDMVQTDGWVLMNLPSVAADMGVPYPTIKRWWRALVDGPFFDMVVSAGRGGVRARFAQDWVDWRVLSAREKNTEIVSEVIRIPEDPEGNRTEIVSELIRIPDETDQNSSKSNKNRTKIVSDLNAPYIGTHDLHDLHVDAGSCEPGPPAPSEDPSDQGDSRPPKRGSPEPLRVALAQGSGIDLEYGTGKSIAQVNVNALKLWENMREPGWDVDRMVLEVRRVGKWVRATQHPYATNPDQRIPPSAILDFWKAAQKALKAQDARNGATLVRTPDEPVTTPQKTAQGLKARLANRKEQTHAEPDQRDGPDRRPGERTGPVSLLHDERRPDR